MNKKVLYHLSKEGTQFKWFQPRVPLSYGIGEENTIKRVCFSDSIEGAMSALSLHDFNVNDEFTIYEYIVDVDNSENVTTNKEIVKNNWVPDACYTGEYWLKEPLFQLRGYKVKIKNFKKRDVLVWEIMDFYLLYKTICDNLEDYVEIEGREKIHFILDELKNKFYNLYRNKRRKFYKVAEKLIKENLDSSEYILKILLEHIKQLPWSNLIKYSNVELEYLDERCTNYFGLLPVFYPYPINI